MDNSNGYKGAQDPESATSEFNEQDFHIRQILAQVNGATLVKVVSATNSGALSAVGFVDVMPLILQADGYGTPVDANVIHDVPYFRLQGGARAIIIDPVAGDIGIAIFADKDISSVKASRAQSLPGSQRRNDMADALYIGGVLNGAPSTVIRMQGNDIHAQCPGNFIVDAGGVFQVTATDIAMTATDGSAQMSGNFNVTGEVTANGIPLSTHKHTGVQTGGGTSGGPTP